MTSTPRIPKAEITGIDGDELKRFSRELFGDVPEPAEVMWHNRAVLTSAMGFGREVQRWDQLDSNLKSFAHMAVAALVGCSWCLDLNYFQAHNEGLDVAKASEVPRWRESPVFTSLERDDLLHLGDDLDVGSVVGEALHEGGDALRRRVQHAVDASRLVLPVTERVVGLGVCPVGPRPGVWTPPESEDVRGSACFTRRRGRRVRVDGAVRNYLASHIWPRSSVDPDGRCSRSTRCSRCRAVDIALCEGSLEWIACDEAHVGSEGFGRACSARASVGRVPST